MNEGINLASARLGAEAVACSDEFFAAMSRLIDDSEPVYYSDRFDDHGQWMDGCDTRASRPTPDDLGPSHIPLGSRAGFRCLSVRARTFGRLGHSRSGSGKRL